MKTLIITEKPSVARDIAKELDTFEKGESCLTSPSYVITWAFGHLLELAQPEDYDPSNKFWTITKLPIIPEEFKLKPIKSSEKQLKEIVSLIKKKEIKNIINACDAGREGELIFRNVLEYAETTKKHQRLWLSSMTKEAIKKAFESLSDGENFESLAQAAKCRSHADWIVGINATRAVTRRCGDLFSLGRVQTPTLSILVERELEIKSFTSRKYYEITANFISSQIEYKGKWIQLKSKLENLNEIENKQTADEIANKINGKEGIISSYKSKEVKESHPLLFDLTELQREANKRFGYTATRTLQIAQTLYEEKKILTYPRTDSRYLPADMLSEIPTILTTLSEIESYEVFAKNALQRKTKLTNRVINDAKVSDHFAIIPTKEKYPLSKLKTDEQKIYDLVSRRFLSIFFDPAIYQETTMVTSIMEETFESKEKVLTTLGFREVYGDNLSKSNLSQIKKGDTSKHLESTIEEKETKPRPRYNEATLLSAMQGAGKLIEEEDLREAMKEKGIGTPATRAQIIERLVDVEYCLREGKELVPTDKGIYLINLLSSIPLPELSSPELTGSWEKKLLEIEEKKLDSSKFMKDMILFATDMIQKIKTADFDKISGAIVGVCPLCGSDVVTKGKVYACSNTSCKFKISKRILSGDISPEIVQELLTLGKTKKPISFKSSQGKKFQSFLILNENKEVKFEFVNQKEDISDEILGICPICKGNITEKVNSYGCSTEGCTFRVGKYILTRPIQSSEMKEMLSTGRTQKLSGFLSKNKKRFSAILKLTKEGKIEFDFGK
jgi:DNA topoisomerase-3